MASGLAARVKEVFGYSPRLIEGHNGIYEVSINGRVAATNQGRCRGVPSEDEILSVLRKQMEPLPGKGKEVKTMFPMA